MITIKEWIYKEQRKHHRCKCGCGQFIKILKQHKNNSIPKFIFGHRNKSKKITLVCKQCNKEFKVKLSKSKQLCCTRNCYNKYKIGKERKEKLTFICKYCGKEFKDNQCKPNRVFCSYDCYWDYEIGKNNHCWKGGSKTSNRKGRLRRYSYFNPNSIELNKKFKDSEGHHIDNTYIINIPYELHQGKGSSHVQTTGKGMKEMNKKAFKYLYENQKNMLVSIEEAFKINLIVNNKWK